MIIQSIRLKDFRIHTGLELELGPGLNLICGPNGIGKTNILEAIHYLALTKGFLTSSDQFLLKNGTSFFEINGAFSGVRRSRLKVRAVYAKGEGKKLFVNGSEIERKTSHVGVIPIVLLCPQDQALTAGGPAERRRFLDNIISQSSSVYLDDLLRYRRALRQRNEVLQHLRRSSRRGIDPGPAGQHGGGLGGEQLLDSWTNELVETGSRIVATRNAFCKVFSDELRGAHERLGETVERPEMAYVTIKGLSGEYGLPDVQGAFRAALDRQSAFERKRGVTMVGPHRDELEFRLNGLDVRRYASQGQHRTFGMALKLAQYRYLFKATEEPPILLLDDVFDNLDGRRIALFLEILGDEGMGQTIITAARKEILASFIKFDGESVRLFELNASRQDPAAPISVQA